MSIENESTTEAGYCSNCGIKRENSSIICSSCGNPADKNLTSEIISEIITGVNSRIQWFESKGYPVRSGAIVGSIAFVLTTVLTTLTGFVSPTTDLSEYTSGEMSLPIWKVASWIFYSSHGAEVRVAVGGASAGISLVASSLVYLLPPLVLVSGGYFLARHSEQNLIESIKRGSAVTAGYSLLSIVGIFTTTYSITIFVNITVKPDPVTGILLAGILYPLIFGSIGGGVAYKLNNINDSGTQQKIRKNGKIIIVAVIGLILLGSGLTSGVVIGKGNPADLEVVDWEGGHLSTYSDSLQSKVVVKNTGDKTVVTSLKTIVSIDNGGVYSASEKIRLEPGESKTYNHNIVSLNTLTSNEDEQLSRGRWSFTIKIGGESRVNQ